jgi:hypothetical protein
VERGRESTTPLELAIKLAFNNKLLKSGVLIKAQKSGINKVGPKLKAPKVF